MLSVTLAGCQGSDITPAADVPALAQPYAGLQERDIRALAPERVADLLAGRGAGYALAAELNHYPGPTHVLELEVQLGLSTEQQEAVSSSKAVMQQEAAGLGSQLVDLEEELDQAFRSGAITSEELSLLTSEIALVEGNLRNVHLQTHLQMVEVLTPEQIALYDELRGYMSMADHDMDGSQH